MRYFLEFAYDGTAYHGWQRQPNAISVQQVMEECMSTLLGSPLELVAAGRTDAGVHARKMVAHFDWEEVLPQEDIIHRLNSFLPEDIAISAIRPVQPEAHARFDATSRTYEYLLTQEKDPFLHRGTHRVHHPLDFDAMNTAASLLLEFEDFKCFSRTHTDVKTFLCDIREAHWSQKGETWVFTITADRFLRNMVRAIVGTLLLVGKGSLEPEGVKTIIKSRDRSQAGASVPAKGLYLIDIQYPQTTYPDG
ncbi:tRNA pseudouridine38-40 synthase [Robiginitalea myxolifaciens]|uniref:tRNA pseudouridine synthase A n=1 Tax=Robiginitalea myxolifaciens TaxID=400055 RepID=A0A1I6HDX8_9FLAO|nr:tRNA pseudouridine(38-40) synthase TruA [Robiginitalea myxolifaciens]SFR52696.1 tRNA pseudouridine38-40 synthase [Robiginitalea myxolifaciens]